MPESEFDIELLRIPESIKIIREIGLGGAGWVIHVQCSEKDYALKVLRPDIASKEAFKNSFLTEARRIRANKHQNIVEVFKDIVVNYNLPNGMVECPAFFMEYLPWENLNEWIAKAGGDSTAKYRALIVIGGLLLDVLDFLHTREDSKLLHLDIKSENIKVQGSLQSPRMKLLDFGVAQHFGGDEVAVTAKGENIKFVGTPRHWPDEWIKAHLVHMTNRDRTLCIIPREWANPRIDLHLFRGTILEALDNAKVVEAELHARDYNALQYYKSWLERLVWSQDPVRDNKIQTAHEARLKANRAYGWDTRTSVLFGRGNLRLPLENLGYFGDSARKVVDTIEFQRLRGLRQLGFVHYVYPGGVHSRFEHSLGVYASAIKYLNVIANRAQPQFRTLLDEEDLRMTATMALIHDLGHYPFSHQIEEADVPGFPVHETFTYRLLSDNNFAKTAAEAFRLDKSKLLNFSIFCLEKVENNNLNKLVGLPKSFSIPPTWRALKGVINGPIDADKFDYLRRDAHHVGVPYSNSLDPERFIDGLTVYCGEKGFDLAVRESSMSSAEMFALGRYFMYTSVYYNHGVRCFDRLIQEALHLKVDDMVSKGKLLFDELAFDSDDCALQKILHECKCGALKQHILNRVPYKRLSIVSSKSGKEDNTELLSNYSNLSFYDRRRVESELLKEINSQFGTKFERGHILVDLPGEKAKTFNIPIVAKTGSLAEGKTALWKSVTENFEMTVRKLRVFANEYPRKWGSEEEMWLKEQLETAIKNAKKSSKPKRH